MMIYLGGPIDQVSEVIAEEWRDLIIAAMPETAFYIPSRAFGNPIVDAPGIIRVNNAALMACDMMFCKVPTNVPAIGTFREIELARTYEKPVWLVGDWHRSLAANDCIVIGDFKKAVKSLREAVDPTTEELDYGGLLAKYSEHPEWAMRH